MVVSVTSSGHPVNGNELSDDGRNPVNGEESCENAPGQTLGTVIKRMSAGPTVLTNLTLYRHPQGRI